MDQEDRTVTDNEARKKMCCVGVSPPNHRGHCIASSCMAWRWDGPVMVFQDERKDDPPPEGSDWELVGPTLSYGGPIFNRYRRVNPDRSGHCGLVGPTDD